MIFLTKSSVLVLAPSWDAINWPITPPAGPATTEPSKGAPTFAIVLPISARSKFKGSPLCYHHVAVGSIEPAFNKGLFVIAFEPD